MIDTDHTADDRKTGNMTGIDQHLARLDAIVQECKEGNDELVGVLSSGEVRYVALAANRPDLLNGDTIPEAIRLLDDRWLEHMLDRWTW